jgi:hypothetical protein
VDYQVRTARITDIDRLVALASDELGGGDDAPLAAGDLLRQLVFIPQASVFVAESRRSMAGFAVLALRPSIRAGGYIGTVDLLVVGPGQDEDRVTAVLLDEIIRSAGNKGCSLVEAPLPSDPDTIARWERHGFSQAGPNIERAVKVAGAAGRRS